MLSEEELERAYNQIRWRIDKVNDEYLELVGEQIREIGTLTPSSMDRLSQMRTYGANVRRLKRKLARVLEAGAGEVQQLLEKAAREEFASPQYQAVVRDRGPVPLEFDQTLQRYIRAIAAQTQERFFNYSNTTNLDGMYREVVSDAVDAVSRGVADYNSAIRAGMRKLGGSGLRVTYESGVTRRLDTAIRMNIIDGVKHVAEKAQEEMGRAIGADGVELSAHPYSAPDHEPAQGRQYAMEEYRRMQEGRPFRDVDGNGYKAFRRPISEWNCRHFASHILLGVSPRRYTDEQLKQWRQANREGCVIDGKRYSRYEASQLMRQLETKVRGQKDIANLAKASGDDVLRRECQANIRDLKAKYAQVAQAAGLRRRTDKMIVEGYRESPLKSAAGAPRNTGKLVAYNPKADFSISLDGHDQRVISGLTRASAKVAAEGGKDGKEHLSLVDLKSGALVYHEDGSQGEVGGPDFWAYVREHPYQNLGFVHNHNTDGFFSETDMRTLLYTHNIKMFVAVRLDGVKYIAEKIVTPPRVPLFDMLYQSEIDSLTQQLKDGIITAGERTRLREIIIVENLLRDYTKGLIELDGRP